MGIAQTTPIDTYTRAESIAIIVMYMHSCSNNVVRRIQ